jgi:hypothetical protein
MASPSTAAQEDADGSSLPSLPLVSLPEAVAQLLASVRALPDLSAAEQGEFEQLVTEYAASPAAVAHHEALVARRQSCQQSGTSWLAEWWTLGYLQTREPLWLHSNVWISMKPFLDSRRSAGIAPQLEAASRLVAEAWRVRRALINHTFPVDKAGAVPLDMSQYHRFFGTVRQPGHPQDVLRTFAPHESQHIVVVVNGAFFVIDLAPLEASSGCSAAAIARALRQIFHQATNATAAAPQVGWLTTLDRSMSAAHRRHLQGLSARNARDLERLESAAFVLCLDVDAPGTPADLDALAYHGHGRWTSNRWYDKSAQIIVTAIGTATSNFDHSWVCYQFHWLLSMISFSLPNFFFNFSIFNFFFNFFQFFSIFSIFSIFFIFQFFHFFQSYTF